jgi:hypothetical protein
MTRDEIRKRLTELRDKQLEDMGRFSFALGEYSGEIKALERELKSEEDQAPESKNAPHINGEAQQEAL